MQLLYIALLTQVYRSTLWPDHCVQGSAGAELVPELSKHKLSYIIEKGDDKRLESYSAFGPPFRDPPVATTDLDRILKSAGVTHVFVVGLSFDVCVRYTALDAVEHGYRTFIVEDGVNASARNWDARVANRKELQSKGVAIIALGSTELDIAKGV